LLAGCVSAPSHESTGQYIDSSGITAKVKSDFLADPKIKSLPITVNTYKNVVQLSGFVTSKTQEDRAVSIASAVPGVRSVKNDLIVRQ
jgi:hypothetical protein